ADVLDELEAIAPVRPRAAVLRTIQDRMVQKQFLDRIGLPQTPWAPVDDVATLHAALARVGRPAILKVRRAGYDGKGQVRLEARSGEVQDDKRERAALDRDGDAEAALAKRSEERRVGKECRS